MDSIECASRYDEYCPFRECVSSVAISCTPYVSKFEDGRAVLDNRAITTLQQCFLSDIIRTILAKVRSVTDQVSSGVINSWSCFSHVFSGMRAALPHETIDLLESQGFHFTTMDIPLREYTATQLELVRMFLSIQHYHNYEVDKSLFAGWKPPIDEDMFESILVKEVMETESGKEVVLQDNGGQNEAILEYLTKVGAGKMKERVVEEVEEVEEEEAEDREEVSDIEAMNDGEEEENDARQEQMDEEVANANPENPLENPPENPDNNLANNAADNNSDQEDRPIFVVLNGDGLRVVENGMPAAANLNALPQPVINLPDDLPAVAAAGDGPTPIPPSPPSSPSSRITHIPLSNPFTALSMQMVCGQFFPNYTHKTSLFLHNFKGLLDLIDQVLSEASSDAPRSALQADLDRNACASHSTATAQLDASKVPLLHAAFDELAQVEQTLAEQIYQRSQAPAERLRELDLYMQTLYQRQSELRSRIAIDLLDCLLPLAIPAAAQLYSGYNTLGIALEPFQCLTDLLLNEEPINFDDLSTLQSLSFSLSRPDSPRSLSPLRRYPNSTFLRSGHPSSRLRPPHPHRQEARPPRGNSRVRRHPGRSEAAARAIRRDPRDAERQLHRRLSERTRGVAQAARRRVSRGNQA